MKPKFDVKVKSTKLESGDWLFGLTLERVFTDEDLHPAFKNNGEFETIIDDEHKKRFIQMVYEFLKKNIEK